MLYEILCRWMNDHRSGGTNVFSRPVHIAAI
jgi:hypothetical protein